MGIGMGLFWLIVAIVVAYLIYKLIKNEKILVPKQASYQKRPRIFWLRCMQRES
jgi:hypothetical protein